MIPSVNVLFNTRKFPQYIFLFLRVQQENAWIKMNRSVSFSQFIKNDKNYKSQTESDPCFGVHGGENIQKSAHSAYGPVQFCEWRAISNF